MNWNGIITVGDDWRDWPRETWGSQDRAKARREARGRAEVKALTTQPPRAFEPLPVVPLHTMPGFSLNPAAKSSWRELSQPAD
jgi:hypothetical protein